MNPNDSIGLRKQEVMRTCLGEFLNQTEWWATKDGLKNIDEMTSTHRRRAAMILLRKSQMLAVFDLIQEMLELPDYTPTIPEIFSRVGAPQDWVKDKPLYKKIIDAPDADPDTFFSDDNVKV